MHRNPYELPLISLTMALIACGLLGYTVQTFMSLTEAVPKIVESRNDSCLPHLDHSAPLPERIVQGKFPRIPRMLTLGTYRLHSKTRVMEPGLMGITSSTKEGMGSSFAVDLSSYGLNEKRYVITAAHCILIAGPRAADIVELEVRTTTSKHWVKCKPLIIDKDRDAALLMTEEELPLTFEMDNEASVGDPVIVGGCPAGTTPSATMGFLTSKDPEINGGVKCVVWQISVPFFYGNSGGPVIAAETNKVLGILIAGLSDGKSGLIPGIALCIPADELKRMIEAYIEMKNQPVLPIPAPVIPKVVPPLAPAPLPPPLPKAEIVPIPPLPLPGK